MTIRCHLPATRTLKPRLLWAVLALAAASLAAPTPSHASLIFDFTITGAFNTPGTVKGEIDGLTNNSNNQAATQVIVDSIQGIPAEPFSLPLVISGTNPALNANTFNVQNDQITAADFNISLGTPNVLFELGDPNTGIFTPTGEIQGTTVFSLAPAPVPEPGSLLLLGTALASLGLLRRRRPKRGTQASELLH